MVIPKVGLAVVAIPCSDHTLPINDEPKFCSDRFCLTVLFGFLALMANANSSSRRIASRRPGLCDRPEPCHQNLAFQNRDKAAASH